MIFLRACDKNGSLVLINQTKALIIYFPSRSAVRIACVIFFTLF